MSPPSSPLLHVDSVSVRVGATRFLALDEVSFELGVNERVALLGPSGCGKTTSLRATAGFERVDQGRIVFEGRVLSSAATHAPPHERAMGMMFQDFALFPHLTVADNVGFGLFRLSRGERAARVGAMLELVGLDGLGERKPHELSGGQEQRVALARALAPHPRLVLLDEPFSSLDANLRVATRQHTAEVLASVGATALLVTHDQAEAMSFADRLIVLRDGRVEQAGTPEELYGAPKSAFVARFLGAANILEGRAEGASARTALGEVPLSSAHRGDVVLCIRPEALRVVGADAHGARGAPAEIVSREFHGATYAYRARGDGFDVEISSGFDVRFAVGDHVVVTASSPASVLPSERSGGDVVELGRDAPSGSRPTQRAARQG